MKITKLMVGHDILKVLNKNNITTVRQAAFAGSLTLSNLGVPENDITRLMKCTLNRGWVWNGGHVIPFSPFMLPEADETRGTIDKLGKFLDSPAMKKADEDFWKLLYKVYFHCTAKYCKTHLPWQRKVWERYGSDGGFSIVKQQEALAKKLGLTS